MSDQGDNSSEHSGDMDAELDSDQEQDLDKILGSWLGELENMTQNLDSGSGMEGLSVTSPPPMPSYNNLDNFRFTLNTLEDPSNSSLVDDDSFATQNTCAIPSSSCAKEEETQDVDLDALLGDLCKMEQSLNVKTDSTDFDAQNSNSVPMFPSYSDLGKPAPPAVKPKPKAASPTSQQMSPPPPPYPPPAPVEGEEDQDLPPPPPPTDAVDGSSEPLPPPPPPSQDASMADDGPWVPNVGPPPNFEPRPPPQESKQAPPPPVKPKPAVSPPPPVAPKPSSDEKGTPTRSGPPLTLTINPPSSPPPAEAPGKLVSSPTGTHLGQESGGATSPLSQSVRVKLKDFETQLMNDTTLTEDEKQAKLKAEKIKIALEKLKKARVQKLIVKVFTEDNSAKTIFVDETMSTRAVVHTLVEKNHFDEKPDYSVVEQIPDLYMERVVEDHEHLVTDVMANWTRDTNNRLLFAERREKYALFKNPQHFLLSSNTSQAATEFAEKSKQALIDEFFSSFNHVPELEGPLFLKTEGKKSWKKYYCLLRASGLYYSPKGKSKLSKDLVCLVQFEHYSVYNGVGWKKKYKSPTDHCFALKHPQIQQKSKYIKYMCAEDYRSCQRWITGIRIAKYGKALLDNYNDTQREMSEYASSIESMSQSSLGDSSSISSMHSSASTQSTHSSQGSTGISPSGSSLAVPQLQQMQQLSIQRNVSNRTSSVGNMFASAWKKGVEAEQTNTKGTFKSSVVTPTMAKGNNPQTFDNIDVQQSLLELELEMDRDQSAADNQRKTSINNANNLNNSNAVCVHVTANNKDPVAVTVITQSGPQVKGLPPPNLNKKSSSSPTGGTQLAGVSNKKTTSIISTSKQRGVSPSRGENGKRVQFKEDLEENIPVHSSDTPPPSPHTPAKPILSNSNTSQGYQPSYTPRYSYSYAQSHPTSRPVSFPNTEQTHYALPQHTRSHSISGVQPMSPPIARSSPSPHNIQLIDAHPIPHAISHQVALGHSKPHHGKPQGPGSPVMRINANAMSSSAMSRNQQQQQQQHSPVTLINANTTSQRVGSPKATHDNSPPVYHVLSPSLMPKSHKPQAIVQPQTQASSPHGYRETGSNIYAPTPKQQQQPQSPSAHQQQSHHIYSPPQQSSPRSSPYPSHPSRSSPVDIISPRSPQQIQQMPNGSPMSPPTHSRQTSSSFLHELNSALKPRPGVTINNNNLISKPPPSPRNRMTRQDIPFSQAGQNPYNPSGSQSPRQGHPPRVMYPVDGPPVKQGIQSPPQSPGGVNAIRVLPQSPGVTLRSTGHPNAQLTRQTSNKGPKPPPPPRRTDSGSLGGKKVPPPPPQRTT
ncbi:uncharacterized protein [Amphiura filiformis]|uniref:uncharacterized protein isoform X3 n=1 Tax=Amphiura filiformis TaxID=82378 RepID=UPI003B21AF96